MSEQFANDADTLLNGGINDSVTSIDVDSATGFPAAATYRIIIDSEIMIVTAGAGTTTWTVTRGAEGTTAASHSDNAPVTHTLTRDGLKTGIGDLIGAGVYASRPTAGREGQIYFPNEGNIFQRDDGTIFRSRGPLHKFKEPPVASSWAWINQGTSTLTDQAGEVRLEPQSSSADNLRLLKITAPSAPYTIKAAFRACFAAGGSNFRNFGIALRESSSGKVKTLSFNFDTSWLYISVYHWTSATVFSTSALARSMINSIPNVFWLKIEDNNTNCLHSISFDGQFWIQVHSESRTTFCTHDEIGWYCSPTNTTAMTERALWLSSWEVT